MLSLKPASLRNIEFIMKVEKDAFSRTERFPITNAKWLLSRPDVCAYILYYKRTPIGYFIMHPLEGCYIRDKDNKLHNSYYLWAIAVLKKYQNKGGGGFMMKKIEEVLKTANIEKLKLHTSNPIFLNYCLKQGFKEIKKIKNFENTGKNSYYLEKSLR